MIIRSIDSNHDWNFGQGQQNYLTGLNAINENNQTRLLEFLGDCFFNLQAGIDWFRLLGTPGTKNEIMLTVRAKLLASFGVTGVNKVSSILSGRGLNLSYNINTQYTSQFTQELEVLTNVQ